MTLPPIYTLTGRQAEMAMISAKNQDKYCFPYVTIAGCAVYNIRSITRKTTKKETLSPANGSVRRTDDIIKDTLASGMFPPNWSSLPS
ncbi:hypothetical protein OUZ56_004681 [Daphnia magna]|uniref:Uncharacterized protein n=1 Tax=Daphnia magna TaxID=35525 RepID=A0ABQ9YQJ0_9CRUS|nr:hypothetical protein OUZ56_004681 [Daphnia magna]